MKEAADLMGVSPQTVINWANRGRIKRAFVTRGFSGRTIAVFDPQSVVGARSEAMIDLSVRNDPGKLAAIAFRMFEKGDSARQVVMMTRCTPDIAEALHERWADQGGARITISQEAKRKIESIFGRFDSVADLIELMKQKVPDVSL